MASSQQEMPLREGDLQDLQIKRIMEGRQFEKDFLASIPQLPDTPSSLEVVKSFARSLNNRIDAIKAVLTPDTKPSYRQCTFHRFLSHPDLKMKELIPFVENLNDDLLTLENNVEKRNEATAEPSLVDDNARAPSHSRDLGNDDKKPAMRKREQPAEGTEVICLDSDSEPENEEKPTLPVTVKKEPGTGSKRRSNPITSSPSKRARPAGAAVAVEPTGAVLAGDKAAEKATTKSEPAPTKKSGKVRDSKMMRDIADFNAPPVEERRGTVYEYDLTSGDDEEDDEPATINANSRVAVKRETGRTPCGDASRDEEKHSGTSQAEYGDDVEGEPDSMAATGVIQEQEKQQKVDAENSNDGEPEQTFTSGYQSGAAGTSMEKGATEEPQPEIPPFEANAADPGFDQEETEEESRLPDVSNSEVDTVTSESSNFSDQDTPSTAGGEVPELQGIAAAETDPPAGGANGSQAVVTPEIKAEMTRKEVKKKREVIYKKYKDRYLLDRHSPSGVARLGGKLLCKLILRNLAMKPWWCFNPHSFFNLKRGCTRHVSKTETVAQKYLERLEI